MQIGKLATMLFGILLIVIGWIGQSDAEVNVNVGVFAPPSEYVVHAHPTVVVIPGTYVGSRHEINYPPSDLNRTSFLLTAV